MVGMKLFFNILKSSRMLLGLPLVYLGVLLLAAKYFLFSGDGNALLLVGLLLVVLGIVLYVLRMKRESAY